MLSSAGKKVTTLMILRIIGQEMGVWALPVPESYSAAIAFNTAIWNVAGH
jgi:hypothetical protein